MSTDLEVLLENLKLNSKKYKKRVTLILVTIMLFFIIIFVLLDLYRIAFISLISFLFIIIQKLSEADGLYFELIVESLSSMSYGKDRINNIMKFRMGSREFNNFIRFHRRRERLNNEAKRSKKVDNKPRQKQDDKR